MLSLSLRARLTDPVSRADVLASLEPVVRALEPDATFERPEPRTLAIAIHPAAGPVEITHRDRELALEAQTGSAGPGYHAFVCTLADAIAASLALTWKASLDPALYFAHRDPSSLERAALDDLARTVRDVLALADKGASGFALALPEGLEVAHDGLLATPLGPRDRAWLERVAREPQHGRDVFAWPSPARDAQHFLGIALSLAWLEVRWRKPMDERERAVIERVVTSLERAHGLDASLEYPWGAWAECFALLGEESLRATRAQLKADEARERRKVRPGYRRQAVRVALSGGWSIAIPGELAERWDERGTWVASDPKRSVWITSAEAPEGHDTAQTLAGLPELPGEGDTLAMERGPIRGAMRFELQNDEQGKLHVAHAHAALGRHLVVGTFLAREETERETFLEMWGSLDHPDAAA
ncbi:MAG: hypothetical protein K1X94_02890 [Sandaracinaceae bacterium]|nr:hypothetical protein [Sandaracinaceae bacterium]